MQVKNWHYVLKGGKETLSLKGNGLYTHSVIKLMQSLFTTMGLLTKQK